MVEARDRVGGRTLNHDDRRRQGGRGRRPVGRAHPAPDARARPGAGGRHVPDPRRGRERDRVARENKRYRGAIPRINPADPGRRRAGAGPPGPDGAPRSARGAVGGRPGAAAGTPRPSPPGSRRNVATAGARTLFEIAVEAVWAQEPADLSLLHVLFYTHSGGGFDALIGTSGGAQQDRFVGGSQLVALRLAEALGDERVALAGAGAADRARARRRDRGRRRPGGARTPRDRRAAARAGGPDRLRPAAAGLSATSSPSAWRRAR